ncbi:protein rep [Nostoc sp. CHAB 5715]|nr:protein rep [Nostoc sp. CHAB 5715]MCC5620193.1 protein rep [Nostoc sp. CHAB 5715]
MTSTNLLGIHTSAIAKHHNPSLLIPEILKYQVKESDLVGDRAIQFS